MDLYADRIQEANDIAVRNAMTLVTTRVSDPYPPGSIVFSPHGSGSAFYRPIRIQHIEIAKFKNIHVSSQN